MASLKDITIAEEDSMKKKHLQPLTPAALYARVLATSKSGTHWEPRDQGLDGGLVSSLRALL